jgi:DNA-binding NtrC family response regulator
MSNVIPFRRTPETSHPRRNVDRRAFPRGGRRATDKAGHAPLVLLVDHDAHTNARCEAILAKLHFAVAPTRTIDEARRVMESLRPNIIVATVAEAAALRQSNASDLPVVILNEVMDPETLVDEIRRELRAHVTGA